MMKQYKPIKGFDAVAFKEKAQRELYLKTRHMTPSEEIEFYRAQTRKGSFAYLYNKDKEPHRLVVQESPAAYKTHTRKRK